MCEISILVPVYNVEKYISKCIKSILEQSFKNFELILVNDGSTDKSLDICKKFELIDSRIRIINKKNGGLSSARNTGIENAKGKYIIFIDGDDYIHYQMIELLYKGATICNADISMCDFLKVKEDQTINMKDLNYKHNDNIIYSSQEALNKLYTSENVKFIIACNKLYKKSLFNNLRYDIGKIHEDEFIIHKLLFKSKKICYIPKKLYYYLQHDKSITNTSFNIGRLDYLDALSERIRFFDKNNMHELVNLSAYEYCKIFFKYYFKCKNEVQGSKKILIKKKLIFITNLKYTLGLKYFCTKEKILWIIFSLNSRLYEYICRKKGIKYY